MRISPEVDGFWVIESPYLGKIHGFDLKDLEFSTKISSTVLTKLLSSGYSVTFYLVVSVRLLISDGI